MATIHSRDLGSIRMLGLDNPPVNALSFAFSAQLLAAVDAAQADASIDTIVFAGANDVFSGGADINDFGTEPTPETKTVRDVIAAIERSDKTYIAAIDGNALGGGLELALACDYRLATKRSKLGLPEIKLGLLPGAGGTQRLPRLIGAQAALEFMLRGNSHAAEKAKDLGVLDDVVDVENVATLVERAVAARRSGELVGKRRISERKAIIGKGITMQALPFVVSQAHKMVPAEEHGGFAAHRLIDAVEAAVEMPFAFGLAREARLFEELARSSP